ncbi:hypothetical protein PWT90_10566 [Aphanocladium album]|nr:hypothetical protein PWT90_10566 [Aphanocladium album]
MDDSFGPRLLGHFDFTLLFEHTMFYMIPSSIIIFCTPYYIYSIFRGPPVVRGGLLLCIKLTFAAALIGLHVANAVLWSESSLDSKVANAAAIMSCIGALCIAILTFAGHVFFVPPQAFLGLFLSVTMLFDIATTLTYFNRTGLGTIACLHIPIPVVKLALISLEEVSKRPLIRSDALRSSLGHEAMAGFWNRSLLVWVNSVLLFGFKEKITQSTLPGLGPQFDSEYLHETFESHWNKTDKLSRFALLKVCVYTMPWPFLYIILPRLLAIGFDFAQPFLLQDVVNAVSNESETSNDVRRGLILATAAIYFGKAISKSWYGHLRNQIMISVRGILVASIYRKSLRLSADDLDASAAITLMTADINGVGELVSMSYDSWARFLEVCAGIAILSAFVGAATIFSIIPALSTTIACVFVARKLMTNRGTWNERIETRVSATSNILAQIKNLKMLGLMPLLASRLQKRYETEVDLSMETRKYTAATFGISAVAEALTPVFVVAGTMFWTRASEPVTAARFFTTLAVITLVTNPLYYLLHTFGNWSAGFACLHRIQKYLNSAEVEDKREFVAQAASDVGNSPPSSVVSRVSTTTHANNNGSAGLIVFAVQVSRISVCTDLSGSILTDVSMDVPMGGVTMVLGPVGCGKSTLLRALLGEAKLRCGTIKLATRSVAYCSQEPWIQNDTIQNNILCGRPLNAVLYRKVIYVCALDVDIARLPQRDQTLAGSEGCSLSGGQKQRLALARSLYTQAELLVLDDVFSSLDMPTSSTVRIRLFSETDILESGTSTVILATSMQQHLADADVAYELDEEGKIDLHANRERERQRQRQLDAQRGFAPQDTAAAVQRTAPLPGGGNATPEGDSKEADKTFDPPEVTAAPDNTARDNVAQSKYGDWTLYKYFLQPAGLKNVLLWLLTFAFAALFDRLPPIFARIWLDQDAENRLYFIGFAVIAATVPVLYYLAPTALYRCIVLNTSPALHKELIEATSQATFEFLASEDAGALLNRFSQDIAMATQVLPGTLFPTVWGFFSLFIDVAVISSGASYALPIIPFFLLILLAIQHFFLYTSRQLRLLELDSSKLLVRHFTETGAGIEHVRAFRLAEDFAVQLYRILDETQKPFYYMYSVQQWLASTMDLTTAGAAILVVSLALNFQRSTSASAMGLSLLSLISFSDFTGLSIQFFVKTENTLGAVARIREFARTTPREIDDDTCEAVPEQWPLSGRVDLHCVSAVYNPESEKPHIALENINLAIEPGDTVGLVGRTGSGKTSVLLTLLHLLEYTGSIYIDGRELRTVPRDLLRTRITTITQGGVAIKASVRFNMDPFEFTSRPGNYPTDDTLAGILRRVGLWDHVVRHGGLNADMKDMKFSVGQKQLFQLARAILHKQITRSNIVLMDEGTASMDAETEQRVYSLMNEAFAGCTKIIISHREAVLAHANLVLNLADGRGDVQRPQLGNSSRALNLQRRRAMKSDRSEEQRPLLHGETPSVGGAAANEPPQPRSTPDEPTRSRRRLVISSLLIMLSSNITSILVDTAGNQLVEGAACKQLHPEVTDWYRDPVCKSLDVQDRLALVTGWEYSWSLVPGMLLAIPYGVFIDRYGPRAMAVLVALGGFINQVTYLAVSECLPTLLLTDSPSPRSIIMIHLLMKMPSKAQYPNIFDLRWIWGTAFLGSTIGGGNIGWQALTFTVCNMISTKKNRAEILFYMGSIGSVNFMIGGFIVYWAMSIGPVFAQTLGCIGFAAETLLAFTLPRGLATGEPVQPADSEASGWEAIRHGFSGIKDGVMGFGKLFSRNRQLGLLLFSLIISTIGARQSAIRQQYVTHRYGWSWGKASTR